MLRTDRISPKGAAVSSFITIVMGIVGQLPLLAVLVVGIVVAIRRRRTNPRAATLALLGFVVALAVQLVTVAIVASTLLVPQFLANTHLDVGVVGWFYRGMAIVNSLLAAVAWVLVVIALYGGRKQAAPVAS
jgi:hypothetical protein